MKTQMFKKLIACAMAAAMLSSTLPLNSLAATTNSVSPKMYVISDGIKYPTGLLPDPPGTVYSTRQDPYSLYGAAATLPDSVDLSTAKYFPPIGSQYGGSCGSFATTYYQFTYEVAKLNNRDAKANSQYRYSPKWSYNFVNNGVDGGSYFADNYNLLKKRGAATVIQVPYTNNDHTSWCNDEAVMRQALTARISNYYYTALPNLSTDTPFTSNKDADLDSLKSLLNSGHLATFACYPFTGVYKTTSGGRGNAMAVSYDQPDTGGHALTIVGYDDTIECDINGNGTIQDFEKGAFKIANSWGASWGNSGYTWVMYDALNKVSAGGSGAISTPYTRQSLFTSYYSIDVANYNPKLIANITVPNTPGRGYVYLGLGISSNTQTTPSTTTTNYNVYKGGSNLSSFMVLLDYSPDLLTSTSQILNSRWYAKVKTSGVTGTVGFKLKDSDNHIVSSTTMSATGGSEELEKYLIYERLASNVYTITPYVTGAPRYISDVLDDTTVSGFISNLTCAGGVELYDSDGNEIFDTDIIGTGYFAFQFCYGTFYSSYDIVVRGDATGDGDVTVSDVVAVRGYITDPSGVGQAYLMAADANKDGVINESDVTAIRNYIISGSW